MLIVLIILATMFLAYWNGANDNFKGVATLYGSDTLSYRSAITIATIATFAGSICSIFLAQGLVASFSGKGLVPADIVTSVNFLLAVGVGAALTVLLATLTGFPISTTHSLIGGLLGAGMMAVGTQVDFSQLGHTFFIPLIVSPFIAFSLAAVVYWMFNRTRRSLGLNKETCVCVGERRREYIPISSTANAATMTAELNPEDHNSMLSVSVANNAECADMYTDRIRGVQLQKILDFAHITSAAMVSFARGLNDTPKIAGILVAAQSFGIKWGMIAIAIVIAIGGLMHARRVAETLSHKITELSHGQGLSANLVTSFLVTVASNFGVPVSTTHVSVGSIAGIGVITGKRKTKMIGNIIFSWIATLPAAFFLSGFIYWLLS